MVSYNTHRIGFVFCWGKYPGKKRGLRNRKKEREREREREIYCMASNMYTAKEIGRKF